MKNTQQTATYIKYIKENKYIRYEFKPYIKTSFNSSTAPWRRGSRNTIIYVKYEKWTEGKDIQIIV